MDGGWVFSDLLPRSCCKRPPEINSRNTVQPKTEPCLTLEDAVSSRFMTGGKRRRRRSDANTTPSQRNALLASPNKTARRRPFLGSPVVEAFRELLLPLQSKTGNSFSAGGPPFCFDREPTDRSLRQSGTLVYTLSRSHRTMRTAQKEKKTERKLKLNAEKAPTRHRKRGAERPVE